MPTKTQTLIDLIFSIAEEEDYDLENIIRQAMSFFNGLGDGDPVATTVPNAFSSDGLPTIISVDVAGNVRPIHQSTLYSDMSTIVTK